MLPEIFPPSTEPFCWLGAQSESPFACVDLDICALIFSRLSFKDLPHIALTCQVWQKLAWTACCQKAYVHTVWMPMPCYSILPKIALALEGLFSATSMQAKCQLKEFIDLGKTYQFDKQIDFISNLFRSLQDRRPNNPQLESLAVHLFNCADFSAAGKLALIERIDAAQLQVTGKLCWSTFKIEEGLIPNGVEPFQKTCVPKHLAQAICIHKDHHFAPGELVAVIDIDNASKMVQKPTRAASQLCFGIIAREIDHTCTIYLQKQCDKYSHLTIKGTHQIGKFLKSAPLPSFCI